MTAGLSLTRHAKQRRREMRVTEDQIAAALDDPDICYPSDAAGIHGGGRRLYVRDPIVVVVDDSTGDVVTVLWHRALSRSERQPLATGTVHGTMFDITPTGPPGPT